MKIETRCGVRINTTEMMFNRDLQGQLSALAGYPDWVGDRSLGRYGRDRDLVDSNNYRNHAQRNSWGL